MLVLGRLHQSDRRCFGALWSLGGLAQFSSVLQRIVVEVLIHMD